MPFEPSPRSVHVDALLTNISVAYRNAVYIADRLAPDVMVKKQTDIIPAWTKSHWFRDAAKLRAPGTKASRIGATVDTTQTYHCPKYSVAAEISDEQRDNADDAWRLDQTFTELVSDKLMLRREVQFAGALFTTGVWTSDVTGGAGFVQWSNYGSSEPLRDIEGWKDNVSGRIGVEPGDLVIGKLVWTQLKFHPVLMDSIKYTQRGQLTPELFASLAELNSVNIGRSIFTSTPEGVAEGSVTYTRIWGSSALLMFLPPSPSMWTPAAAYTIVWNRVPGAKQYLRRIRMDEEEMDAIEANSYFVQRQIVADAAQFAAQVIA